MDLGQNPFPKDQQCLNMESVGFSCQESYRSLRVNTWHSGTWTLVHLVWEPIWQGALCCTVPLLVLLAVRHIPFDKNREHFRQETVFGNMSCEAYTPTQIGCLSLGLVQNLVTQRLAQKQLARPWPRKIHTSVKSWKRFKAAINSPCPPLQACMMPCVGEVPNAQQWVKVLVK